MSATVIPSVPAKRLLSGRRYEHAFFGVMSILIALSVFIGFSHTYYLAGMVRAHLPSPIIHVHGAAFTCWILFLVLQSALASVRRVDLHRRLGIFGFCLACSMVVLGLLAATNSLMRNFAPPGVDDRSFYIVSVTDMVNFSVLIFFAFRMRSNAAAHKRLILMATVALLAAAFVRMHVDFLFLNIVHAQLASYVFLVLIASYDLWSTHKVQRITLLGSAFIVLVQFARMPLSQTAIWQGFAAWAQNVGR